MELAGGMELAAANLSALHEYDFERRFDAQGTVRWMQENWQKSFSFALAYVLLIFGGQYVMKERRGYNLRMPLALWSFSLALFSILGIMRTGEYMRFRLSTSGFKQSVCDRGFYTGPICKFWAFLFVMSKVLELGDTVFIVLRKQKLLFLHWYHHITVLVYSWYAYKDTVAGGGWFMTMNYGVHAFMYSYYTVRAAGLKVPRLLAMVITFSQILQMVMGTTVTILAYSWMQDENCYTSWRQIFWSAMLYLSYLVLFCQFFREAYFRGRGKTKGD